jgi:hypothetical protein
VRASWPKRVSTFLSFIVPKQVFVGARMTFVYAGVIGLAAYGWGVSVSAAQGSLPGDILYNVKKANEKTELFFAGTKSDEKVAVLLNHASRRAEELKQIQALPEDGSKKAERAKTVVDSLKKNIESTNEEIAKAKIDKTVDAVVLVSVVSEKISKLSSGLGTSLGEGTNTTELGTLSSAVKTEVVAVATLAEETKVNAVVTAVERMVGTIHAEAPTQFVAKTLGETISALETTLLTYQAAASSTATGTPPLEVAPVVTPSSASTTVGTTSSTTVSTSVGVVLLVVPSSSTGTTTVSTTVPVSAAPVLSVQEQITVLSNSLVDARALLAQENIRGAVEKMQAALLVLRNDIQPQFGPDVALRAYATLSTLSSSGTSVTGTGTASSTITSTLPVGIIVPVSSGSPTVSSTVSTSVNVAPAQR